MQGRPSRSVEAVYPRFSLPLVVLYRKVSRLKRKRNVSLAHPGNNTKNDGNSKYPSKRTAPTFLRIPTRRHLCSSLDRRPRANFLQPPLPRPGNTEWLVRILQPLAKYSVAPPNLSLKMHIQLQNTTHLSSNDRILKLLRFRFF